MKSLFPVGNMLHSIPFVMECARVNNVSLLTAVINYFTTLRDSQQFH